MFDDTYHNELTGEDALKPGNFAESFGITKKDKLLSIEKRNLPIETDTIFYNLAKMQLRNYVIEFTADNLAQHNLAWFIEDVYLKNKTTLNMNGNTTINFTVTRDIASYAPDRFRIVFKRAISYNTIKAYLLNSDVAINWQVAGEKSINHYEIEKSADGINFSIINNTTAKGNNMDVNNYSGLDEKPAPGIYYYRIKGISNNGAIGYSETVKVVMMNVKAGLYVYPNPVTNGTIGLQMNSMHAGVYSVRLLNSAGQSIVTKSVNHAGGTASVNIQYPAQLTGHYQLEIIGNNKKKTVLKVVIQ